MDVQGKDVSSSLICNSDVSYNIGLHQFEYYDHSTHDRSVTAHDVGSRVFGRTLLKREAGEGPVLHASSLPVPVVSAYHF